MHADHLIMMTRILPMQRKRCELPRKVRRCVPNLDLLTVGYCDVSPVGGESDRGDWAFEGDAVEDNAFSEVDEKGSTI